MDKAQYRGHRDCGTLVCFVYDPDRRLPNAVAIESDLSGHDGGLTTIVVVSPRGLLRIQGLDGLLFNGHPEASDLWTQAQVPVEGVGHGAPA